MTENLPVAITVDDRAMRLAELFAASAKSQHTAEARRRDLTRRWIPWCNAERLDPLGAIRPAHVLAWIAALGEDGDSEPTRSRRVATVSSWYRWLVREGVAPGNPVRELLPSERPRPTSKIHQSSPTVAPAVEQVIELQRTADRHSAVASALIALLAATGARISELTSADVEDIQMDRGHSVLRIVGKGGLHRVLPLPPAALRRVMAHVEERSTADNRLPAVAAGARPRRPLLARSTGNSMLRQEAARLFGRIAEKAGLAELGISPHSLRHAYATDLLAEGVPLYDVQRSLGHLHPETTMWYDHGHLDPDRHPTYRRAAQLAGDR